MLFVPDEDYVRVLDQTSINTATTAADAAAAAAADDDDNDDGGDDGGDGEDEDADVGPVSPSLLFASQAQYLGHSNQVRTIISTGWLGGVTVMPGFHHSVAVLPLLFRRSR